MNLLRVSMRLGSTVAVKEIDFLEPEVVRTPSGYVDIVFDEGRLVRIRDSRGLDTEIGNWIEGRQSACVAVALAYNVS